MSDSSCLARPAKPIQGGVDGRRKEGRTLASCFVGYLRPFARPSVRPSSFRAKASLLGWLAGWLAGRAAKEGDGERRLAGCEDDDEANKK